jgi:hypothetical protein
MKKPVMNKRFTLTGLIAGTLMLLSCNDGSKQNHGPIVLGDSTTIVTETDPEKLRDLVTDLKPEIPSNTEKKDTVAASTAKPADTAKAVKTAATPAALPTVAGLRADFTGVSVLIAGVSAKIAGRGNLQHANGAVYTLENGTINGNTIRVTGNITKVSQRYQTVIMLKNNLGAILIDPLATTTDWEPLKGGNNQYRITGLDAGSLEYSEANANAIRNAVTRAAQRRRMSRRKVQEMVNSVRNVRAANQKPLSVELRSVMWKIDGKDANGRNFSKQIRIDIPL